MDSVGSLIGADTLLQQDGDGRAAVLVCREESEWKLYVLHSISCVQKIALDNQICIYN